MGKIQIDTPTISRMAGTTVPGFKGTVENHLNIRMVHQKHLRVTQGFANGWATNDSRQIDGALIDQCPRTFSHLDGNYKKEYNNENAMT